MANSLSDLNKRFGIPGVVSIEQGGGGLPLINITGPNASGQIYLYGAHLTAWQPKGHKPVLMMSEKAVFEAGKPIRGGVPIAFPWFGPRAADPASPVHGIIRLLSWDLQSIRQVPGGDVAVTLRVASSEQTRKSWPEDFVARFHVTVGQALEMTLEVHNPSGQSWRFEEALHTYFALSDVRQIWVDGLAGTDYLDKVDGFKTKQQEGAIRIAGETDRVYLNTRATCTIHDPGFGRRIVVEKQNSLTTVVWNPWIAKSKAMADFGDEEWPGMLCVEACNAGQNAVTLAPRATHAMRQIVRVEK